MTATPSFLITQFLLSIHSIKSVTLTSTKIKPDCWRLIGPLLTFSQQLRRAFCAEGTAHTITTPTDHKWGRDKLAARDYREMPN